jgi:MFS family permease
MITATFLTFAAVGIEVYYIAVWNTQVRGFSLLLAAAAFTPLAIFGAVAAYASGKIIRYISAEYIMGLGALASAVSLILIATQPEHQIYWAQAFPSLLIVALGPDFIFTSAQIIASNSVKRKHQGIAGSLVGTLASYGLSTGLGFAATVEAYTNDHGRDRVRGYRNALYLGVGLAGLAIVLALLFVRIPKDSRDGWDEDDIPAVQEVKA